ncbi:DUF3311 domain-containing protein [Mumia zhuanghuii]|jgi:hypothetical protein|uniref:DUF3311 domain-containing protein n=1 Tax=Mumia zhuanghuii TaxID=2585211 RepID=A0A5C4MNE2_9ACTN|nr:DUF3311 domain-containing protein [Mumia zhuanghuii]TNC46454.1 DUF3311 domain-containing protein [Mumia zhuanghuii]TNC47162.1 DUF3311 domain-containing protein [Mumia zhuanghuii]
MTSPDEPDDPTLHDTAPPANRALLALAGVLLAIPVIALLWVDSYARVDPKLGPWPFFFWYQFLWVFLTAGLTYTSYRIVLAARPHRPMRHDAADGSGTNDGRAAR